MAENKVTVSIRGLSPLLMHKFPLVPVEAIEKKTPEDQAEIAAYRDDDETLYIPGVAVQRAIVNGATFSKGKGRGSLQKVVSACVIISPARLRLGTTKYEVDAQAVVVPATKGRVVRFRPRINEWAVTFEALYDPNLLSEVQLRRIIDDTGSRVGLLDFRPEKKGPFGRFMVTVWEPSRDETRNKKSELTTR